MKPDSLLLLDLDERNLAHFLAALALAAMAERIAEADQHNRTCWWKDDEHFAIQSEHPAERFRSLLYSSAFEFLKRLKWIPGLGGVAQGILASGTEVGINPFIYLGGGSGRPPLRTFAAKVVPAGVLPPQVKKLQVPANGDWLGTVARGASSSWGFDCRVKAHASDAGISSDAEKTGDVNPFYPAIELLSLAAAAFFVPCHAWQVTDNSLLAFAWTRPIPLSMASLAATGRVHGLPARSYAFTWRSAAHGEGKAYHFFPPASLVNQL